MNQIETITLKPNNQNNQNNEPNINIVDMRLDSNVLMNFNPIPTTKFPLPFDVSNDLAIFSKIFVTKEVDLFRIFHYTETFVEDYKIYGELPTGNKEILFTVRRHNIPTCTSCANCCSQCCDNCCPKKKGCCDRDSCSFCCFGEYICYDLVGFQLDYKRNNILFYNQAFINEKGCHCYCCEGYCCKYCTGYDCC